MDRAQRIRLLLAHCRPKNLLIIALTQLAIYYIIIWPIIRLRPGLIVLTPSLLSMLILATLILAAGGYIINDIIDDPIDRINKGLDKAILHNLGNRMALWAYWGLGISGLLIAAYVARVTDLWNLFWLFPLSWFLLLLYARIFKKTPLFGNLIVSIFCAFVPGIMLVAEWPAIYSVALAGEALAPVVALTVLLLYVLFAFLTTMIREIIKDMEDIEGDRAHECRTLPIVWGLSRTKWIVYLFATMLLLTLIYFGQSLMQRGWWWSAGWIALAILIPMLILLIRLNRAQVKNDFYQLSQAMKWIMLSGLLLLLVIRLEIL